MDDNRTIVYTPAIDEDGNVYIDVEITTQFTTASKDYTTDAFSCSNGDLITSFDWWAENTAENTPTNSYGLAAVDDSGYKVSTAKTALLADTSTVNVAGVPKASVKLNSNLVTDNGTDAGAEIYLKGSSSTDKSFWIGFKSYKSGVYITTPVDSTHLNYTGNLSVSLSSGLVAVLPVSGGAISILYFLLSYCS